MRSIATTDAAPTISPRVISSVFPNAGDTLADAERPVYRFTPEQVAQILEAAGR